VTLMTYIEAEHPVEEAQWEPQIDDPAQQAHHHALTFGFGAANVVAAFGLTDRIGLQLEVPIRMALATAVFQDQGRANLPSFTSIHHRDELLFGLGDVSLGARLRLVRPTKARPWSVELRVGASMPTGRIEPNPFALGREGKVHQHIQFGSGTFDPVAGLDASLGFGSFSLIGWLQGSASLYENRYGYRGVSMYGGGVGLASGLGLRGWRFLFQPDLFVETPARWSGEDARNSGRTSLGLALGASFDVSPSLTASVMLKTSHTLAATGGQLDIPLISMLRLAYRGDLATD
jgi:hypothetical protein